MCRLKERKQEMIPESMGLSHCEVRPWKTPHWKIFNTAQYSAGFSLGLSNWSLTI